MLEKALADQVARATEIEHEASTEGVVARFTLAFGEPALGAIVEEFVRKTPHPDVVTGVILVASHLIATVLVNVAEDEDICCLTGRLFHDQLHKDFRRMKHGAGVGARIQQASEHAPIGVTRMGTPS